MDVPFPPEFLLELQPTANTIKIKIKIRFIFSPGGLGSPARNRGIAYRSSASQVSMKP
jgi:hypothetical protein